MRNAKYQNAQKNSVLISHNATSIMIFVRRSVNRSNYHIAGSAAADILDF